MKTAATTTLSSKGQVVIPEDVRTQLGLKAGTQFVVIGDRDVVIFKILEPPTLEQFEPLVKRVRTAAKRAGLKREDVNKAITKVRRSK